MELPLPISLLFNELHSEKNVICISDTCYSSSNILVIFGLFNSLIFWRQE